MIEILLDVSSRNALMLPHRYELLILLGGYANHKVTDIG